MVHFCEPPESILEKTSPAELPSAFQRRPWITNLGDYAHKKLRCMGFEYHGTLTAWLTFTFARVSYCRSCRGLAGERNASVVDTAAVQLMGRLSALKQLVCPYTNIKPLQDKLD